MHASTNNDVTWFPFKMVCKIVTANGKEVYGAHGGDAMEMLILDDNQRNGGWCDGESTAQHKFICKARIIDNLETSPSN